MFSNPVLLVKFDITNSSDPKYNSSGYTISIRTNSGMSGKIEEIVVLNNVINANYEADRQKSSGSKTSE